MQFKSPADKMQGTAWILLAALVAAMYSTRVVSAAAEYDITGDTHMYGGDILLTNEQMDTLQATSNPNDPFTPQNAVVRNERSLWRNAQVPYVIDGSLGNQARTAIQEAIDEYRTRTCVRFVQRTSEADYVRFFRGSGCFSYIGRVGGSQDISIGSGCEFKGIVMHEMFHALGRWHEQSRPDRDQFVRINSENIQSGVESNFDEVSSTFVTTQGVPYDIMSIMHYGAYAFSRNRLPTIEPIDSSIPLRNLGQRNGFTNSDVTHVNVLYCGGDSTVATWGAWGSWSSCSRTCNGGERSRTRTCNGGSNCEGSNIDREQCNTQSCPVPPSWGTWSSWSGCSASCGGGRQQRQRVCVGGNTCVGINTDFRDCNTQNCPQPATWGNWGSWSSCSATCQGGMRQRNRRCVNGNTCPGISQDTEFCNTNIPCTQQPNPNSGEWSQWSACTKSCGGGVRFRVRMCGQSDCSTQQQSCNTQDCNPEPNLRGLRHVGCYFVRRFSSSLSLLEGTTQDLSDSPFTRENPIQKCGTAAQSQYRFFGISVGYCISGSNRLSDYQYFESNFCNNGVGSYNRGYYSMDVYEIQNQQLFLDSVSQVPTTTEAAPTTTESDVDSDLIVDNGAPVISSNFVLLLSFAFITLLFTFLH